MKVRKSVIKETKLVNEYFGIHLPALITVLLERGVVKQ